MPNGRTSLVLKPVQQMVDRVRNLYQHPSETIRNISQDGLSWYSPMQPVRPFGPSTAQPVAFQIWAGQNLIWTPRSDAEYSAADLKLLASYPLARICLENVKDIITRVQWEVQLRARPGETREQVQRRTNQDNKDLIRNLNDFFQYPDREHNWAEWIRPMIDDLLIIDAPSVLVRKTFKGEIAELAVVRGEMITRYVDQQGFTPRPPSPAYAQNFWGMPFVDLTTDDLIYKPRNIAPRNSLSSQLYGMSPTEQVADEIKVGIARLQFSLSYYTEGSVPGVVHVVPRGTQPDKIEEAMEWMNSQLAGNLAKRNQWRLIQGFNEPGKPDQILFTKEPLLANAIWDEKHIRQIAYAYGVSPQRLQKMIRTEGKGTADAAELEGTLPWVLWVKGWHDFFIQRMLGLTDYEMAMNPFAEPDPLKNAAALTMMVSKAILTPNEARKRVGEELRPEPEADRLGVITGTGFVPVGIPSVQAGIQVDEHGNVKPHTVIPTQPPPEKPPNATRMGTPASQEAGGGRSDGKNPNVPTGKEEIDQDRSRALHSDMIGKTAAHARHPRQIVVDPDSLTPESHQGIHRIHHAVRTVFEKQFKKAMELTGELTEKAAKNSLEKAFRIGCASLVKAVSPEGSAKWIYAMRHGKTALDTVHRSDGWMDFPLSDEGRVKLITAQQYMKEVPLVAVYHSDLKRHRETAEIMSSGSIYHPQLIEDNGAKTWNLGILMGQKKAPNKKQVSRLMTNQDEKPEGGESMNEFRERMTTFLNAVKGVALTGEGPRLIVFSGSNLRELSKEMYGDTTVLDLDEGGMLVLRPTKDSWEAEVLFGGKTTEDERFS